MLPVQLISEIWAAEYLMGWTHEDPELILLDNAVVAGREGERS